MNKSIIYWVLIVLGLTIASCTSEETLSFSWTLQSDCFSHKQTILREHNQVKLLLEDSSFVCYTFENEGFTEVGDTSSLQIKMNTPVTIKPIKMEKAVFQYMYDNLGNTYLDTRNNIPHVGHNHPKVVRAGQASMAKLNTNTRYLYDELTEYSEKLLAKFPASLNKVFFVNSGSAASDLAIRLALTHTQKPRMAVMEYGYHGNTQISIDISHYKFSGKGGKGKPDHILIATAPDTFCGKYTDEQTAGKMYAEEFLKSIENQINTIAAYIAEPIISAAGQAPMPKGYLNEVYDFIKNSNTKEHNTELANKIVNQLKLKNILIGTDGPYDNVLKIKPPLCFTKENTDLLIQGIEKVLHQEY